MEKGDIVASIIFIDVKDKEGLLMPKIYIGK